MYMIFFIFYNLIIIPINQCIDYEKIQKNIKNFNHYYYPPHHHPDYVIHSKDSCHQILFNNNNNNNNNNIEELIKQSDVIIAGRLTYHDTYEKYKQIHSSYSNHRITTTTTNTTTTDTTNNTTTNNSNIYFNITVLVKTIYKANYPIGNEVIIGPVYILDNNNKDNHGNGIGCLPVFYSNAKYIFFLKNNSKLLNYYEPISEIIEYTEYMEKKIYEYYCQNCVKPTIESIPNQVLEYGQSLITNCIATGIPTPTIMWIRDGKSINLADKGLTVETFERSPGYVESILEINNLILIDTGEYWCYAENALGLAKEKFILKVQQNNRTDEKLMVDELIPCSDEDKDYCLNGGLCYMYKNERVSFQCRCLDYYFGDRCHFHTDGLYAFSESRGNDLQSMLHALTTTLTLRGVFFTLFGALMSVLTFYGIWKCQQKSMHRRHLRRRNKSLFKHDSQTKTSHFINHSNHENRIHNTVNDNNTSSSISMNDYYKKDQNIEHIPIPDNYYGQIGNSYILPTSNLVNNECYENRSSNFTPLVTNHVNPQQLHDHSRNAIQFGYRPSSSLDQCNESAHKPENGITLHNRPFGTDWSTRRIISQKPGSIRDRLPVLAEGSNLDLNIDRYPNYKDPIDRMNRFDQDREISLNMISSSSSFIQTNT
ncbi:unnamed protein product [Schistosoma margrebowiei]|uniref:Ig-like domain-containing protein n=1 Tax=Schistosoma margrebowiei TaxID=48269 RepID=A0AA85AMC1_9TREM|nr:unnamed protein product [Schistosoma margrebowiei]